MPRTRTPRGRPLALVVAVGVVAVAAVAAARVLSDKGVVMTHRDRQSLIDDLRSESLSPAELDRLHAELSEPYGQPG